MPHLLLWNPILVAYSLVRCPMPLIPCSVPLTSLLHGAIHRLHVQSKGRSSHTTAFLSPPLGMNSWTSTTPPSPPSMYPPPLAPRVPTHPVRPATCRSLLQRQATRMPRHLHRWTRRVVSIVSIVSGPRCHRWYRGQFAPRRHGLSSQDNAHKTRCCMRSRVRGSDGTSSPPWSRGRRLHILALQKYQFWQQAMHVPSRSQQRVGRLAPARWG
jgi:hypothetical protein